MVGFPYPKYMNSNNDVDMSAALLLCSAATATALGVPRDRWVFPQSGTDCHEHHFISHRWTFDRTPAIELGGRMALELAGTGLDDVDLIDLYSCFPAAVQLGAQSLGLPLDRQLTRTGGLPFAGGPWNNYVMHSIATVMRELRDGVGATGLVWANGGFTTKHAFGVYSTSFGAMLCMIAKLSRTRSSRLMPGLRGLPEVITTMSDPAAASQVPPPITRESEPMIGHVS